MAGFLASCIAAAVAVVMFTANVASEPTHVCARNAPPQLRIPLNSTTLEVGPNPWGVIYLNETIAFASVNLSLAVLDVSEFQPTLRALLPLPDSYDMGNTDPSQDGYQYRELTLSHNKLNLYVATGYGAVIYDVAKAVAGRNDSIAGVLSKDGYVGRSALTLSITPNDEFVFISQEFGSNVTYGFGAVEVYNVTRLDNGTVISTWRGFIALGFATIGQQFSSDFTRLFVTSEMSNKATNLNETMGVINILDVAKLKVTPGKSLINTVSAGCHPVRAQMTADKDELWVSLRDNNQALGFNATALALNLTENSQLATVNTGTSPIGMTTLGKFIMTVDSNRFTYDNTSTGVTVINTMAARDQTKVTFPQIPTGAFPRTLAVNPAGNRLLVAEFDDSTVRVIDIHALNLQTCHSLEVNGCIT
jgi:DNA-binding beta-propeller fold protein YncE